MLNKPKIPLIFWGGAAIVALLLVCVIGTASGLPVVGFGACIAAFAFFSYFIAANYDRHLGARIAQPQPWDWMVHINGVWVGTIPDAQYAALLRKVLRDKGVALDQLAASLKWAIALAAKVMLIVPVVIFWGLALITVAYPDEVVPFLHKFWTEWHAHASGSVFRQNFIFGVGVLSIFSAFLTMPAHSRAYKQASDRLLRQYFHIRSDGNVWVHRLPQREIDGSEI